MVLFRNQIPQRSVSVDPPHPNLPENQPDMSHFLETNGPKNAGRSLGHRSGRITTHYSGAELSKLIESANRVCERGTNGRPELVVLRRLNVG